MSDFHEEFMDHVRDHSTVLVVSNAPGRLCKLGVRTSDLCSFRPHRCLAQD